MKVGLVILDGWGENHDEEARDAVAAASTPQFDRFHRAGATTTLTTDGRAVGLPIGQMGNSEVGHLNIGAGRVVKQDVARISDAIAADGLASNDPIREAFDYADENGGRVHFLGLVSDGCVHASQDHLHALIELAAKRDVTAVTHAFTDGRDTPPKSGESYLRTLEAKIDDCGTGHVASVAGRYYAMDRDENWERTASVYEAIVNREADHVAPTPFSAVTAAYDRGETDEFVEPTLIADRPALTGDDAAVFINFRADRARQLTRMLAGHQPEWQAQPEPPGCHLLTMTEYDPRFELPVAFTPYHPEDTLGEVLARTDHTQLRIAETEKYAHVTYFLNGGREVEFEGEYREIIDSPDVPTYDEAPAMNASTVTDRACEVINKEDPDVVVLNYANPDMVGHTGSFEAAIDAVEAVDTELGRLVDCMQAAGAAVLLTADHGNADDMGTAADPHTAHTRNPVPLVYLAPDGTAGGQEARAGGTLADLAPTILALGGIEQPAAMTGQSLLE
jgi:2,3-bisphosphoglycerate-independent phosphoglycerate mutase